ncbi:MAG: hypothetical protein QOH49_54 [Acidobacteriota bacterium]|jgi:hypothetical protein|nr:hypothetical protein [Acidobacteriota bacterium]
MKKLTLLFASILLATGVSLAAPTHEGHDHASQGSQVTLTTSGAQLTARIRDSCGPES